MKKLSIIRLMIFLFKHQVKEDYEFAKLDINTALEKVFSFLLLIILLFECIFHFDNADVFVVITNLIGRLFCTFTLISNCCWLN
jgi:hypothetical protein